MRSGKALAKRLASARKKVVLSKKFTPSDRLREKGADRSNAFSQHAPFVKKDVLASQFHATGFMFALFFLRNRFACAPGGIENPQFLTEIPSQTTYPLPDF